MRQITVSTVGVPNTLPRLAELALERLGRAQFTLAVNLHAPNRPAGRVDPHRTGLSV